MPGYCCPITFNDLCLKAIAPQIFTTGDRQIILKSPFLFPRNHVGWAIAHKINRQMPQYRRYYQLGSCVFLSIVTHQRRPIFKQTENIQKLRLATAQMKAEMPVDIVAAAILPDHLHFLW
ncbi:MAG: hypothetical protein WBB82_00555 [Limnothrix sp.]